MAPGYPAFEQVFDEPSTGLERAETGREHPGTAYPALVRVNVLGVTEGSRGGAPVDLGTRKQRALVAALALNVGRPVSVDSLVAMLWPDAPPPGVATTLQSYVAGLRRTLEPDRPPRSPATVLVTVAPGYALHLPEDAVDARRFDAAVSAAHRALAQLSPVGGPPGAVPDADTAARTLEKLDTALAGWRGTPYLELDDAPAAVAERARLEELRLLALEDRAVAGLALGHHATVAAELEALTSAHPLRERLWALRAVALTRSGRQADALDVLAEVRALLADELGLDPGAELQALQEAVLRQAPELSWVPAQRVTPAAPAPAPGRSRAAAWPMVGRDLHLAQLASLLDAADAGVPSFAALVGEPGIGKSRLAAELAAVARERGATVLVGRCSQDDGAPPLWPWASVLAGLGAELPSDDQDDEGARFRSWDALVRRLLAEAAERTLLVVLDDLHWADLSSLRVLRMLVETAESGRLIVVATWRDRPEPTGPLGEVAESLARHHAARIALSGLSAGEAAQVVGSVAHAAPSPDQADALRARTDGNPFFLVEYARLARDADTLDALLAEPDPPAAVHDVVVRRLERLPADTSALLRVAAVAGRQFDLATVAAALDLDEETALDRLDPALAAGLLREAGPDAFRFGHALVRDAAYTGLSASRRTRAHARVARALEGRPGRETERAVHWLAAGPAHAAEAWRAAVAAAGVARGLHAHDESADLLGSALAALDQDPVATARDRYDVLMDLAEAYRWSGNWSGLTATAERAVDVAREVGDVELAARAAVSTTVGALWQSAEYGAVHTGIVAALRESLDRLPPEDGALRCRVLLSLANELYYGSTFQERLALTEEAMAMARRLGDEALLLDAYQVAFAALWVRSTAELRLRWTGEAIALAERLGNERALVVSTTLRAVVASELGLVEEMWSRARVAREQAERLHLPYGLIVLDNLELPWLAMAGRFEECEQRLASIRLLDRQLSLPQTDDAVAGSLVMLLLWQGRHDELPAMLEHLAGESAMPVEATVTQLLLRTGRYDEAAAFHADRPVVITQDDWFSTFAWCCAAEVALGLADPELGAAVYAELAPYAGQVGTAGSGVAMGPIDAFLALAAAATGERGLATRHADDALALCEEWGIPLVAGWLRDQRDRHGF